MPRNLRLLALLLLLPPLPASALQLWAVWDLELGHHPPPTEFLVTVQSLTTQALPPAMHVPWASCPQVPGAQHCAPIGCPPSGIYDFSVQAVYEEGTSAPSNTWRCAIVGTACACVPAALTGGNVIAAGGSSGTGSLTGSLGGIGGTSGGTVTVMQTQAPSFPALPQRTLPPVAQVPPGLVLQPLGDIPATTPIPSIPPAGAT